ncbi:MAG: NAD(P)/FAD-dependent oxidoreductase [Archaeoglobaceae archaeon]|nr:NAD(P)/FAD-dependent oxidoreductase [Archaeoglobaceae archaeon]
MLDNDLPRRVVVAGGSIAGLECALRFSDFSEVLLYEKKEEIGKNIKCGEGWIHFNGIRPYVSGRKVNWVDIIIFNPDYSIRRVLNVKINGKVEIIDRSRMEKRMAEFAERKGVEIFTGKKLKLSDAFKLDLDLLVDATGYPSMWCREIGGRRPHASAIHIITDMEEDRIRVMLYPGLNGYFYVFPMPYRGSKIGLCVFDTPERSLRQILEAMIEKSALFGDFERIAYTGGPIGCYRNSPFLRYFNGLPVALVGDAAGIADRFAAEGMTKAVVSSRILAECARTGRLKNYEKEYFRRMKRHYMLTKLLEFVRRNFMVAEMLGRMGMYTLVSKFVGSSYTKLQSRTSRNAKFLEF